MKGCAGAREGPRVVPRPRNTPGKGIQPQQGTEPDTDRLSRDHGDVDGKEHGRAKGDAGRVFDLGGVGNANRG